MASSISGARLALHALLDGAAWPAPKPQVTFGSPSGHEARQVVALMGLQDPDETFAALGAQRKAESYVLEVVVKVDAPGANTAQAVDSRCFALADVVRALIAANPTFAPDTVLPATVISQTTDGALPAGSSGWRCFITVLIRCQTRIT